jgi:hypothetical protein
MAFAKNSPHRHPDAVSKLDTEVSRYVRLTEASGGPRPGWVKCFTCGAWIFWKKADCGHYIPRTHYGTRFDLRNLRCQCTECNRYHEGEHWKFRQKLVETIGEHEVAALELTASMWGFSRHPTEWLESEIKRYRALNKPLLNRAKEWE